LAEKLKKDKIPKLGTKSRNGQEKKRNKQRTTKIPLNDKKTENINRAKT